jgi:hypothetical protein
LFEFIRDHLQLLTLLAMLWTGTWMAFGLLRRLRRGPHFPRFADVTILFREDFVSGSPMTSFGTCVGYVKGGLIVVVTDDEIWVRMVFPYAPVSASYDIENRIPRDSVTNVVKDGKWIYLDFTLPDYSTRRLRLRIRKADQFFAALGELHDA